MATNPFNISPTPTAGVGAYGKVPGTTGLPDVFGELSKLFPNLAGTNTALSNTINTQLSGQLSQGTQNNIKDAAAEWGVASGMPGSGLSGNKSLRDLGIATEAQVQRGLDNYGKILPTIKATQTVSPETQIGLSQQNAALNSAPNPQQNAQALQAAYQNAFNKYGLTNPAGGSGDILEQYGLAPATTPLAAPSFGGGVTVTQGTGAGGGGAAVQDDPYAWVFDGYYNPESDSDPYGWLTDY